MFIEGENMWVSEHGDFTIVQGPSIDGCRTYTIINTGCENGAAETHVIALGIKRGFPHKRVQLAYAVQNQSDPYQLKPSGQWESKVLLGWIPYGGSKTFFLRTNGNKIAQFNLRTKCLTV